MHRIHVRTGSVEVPALNVYDDHPTHDQFIIDTNPNETIVELELIDAGPVDPSPLPAPFETGGAHWRRRAYMRKWRFRAVSVEPVDMAGESDVVVEYDEVDEYDNSADEPLPPAAPQQLNPGNNET